MDEAAESSDEGLRNVTCDDFSASRDGRYVCNFYLGIYPAEHDGFMPFKSTCIY